MSGVGKYQCDLLSAVCHILGLGDSVCWVTWNKTSVLLPRSPFQVLSLGVLEWVRRAFSRNQSCSNPGVLLFSSPQSTALLSFDCCLLFYTLWATGGLLWASDLKLASVLWAGKKTSSTSHDQLFQEQVPWQSSTAPDDSLHTRGRLRCEIAGHRLTLSLLSMSPLTSWTCCSTCSVSPVDPQGVLICWQCSTCFNPVYGWI